MEKPFRDAPAGTRLIETMLWQPGQGVVLAKRHRDRMCLAAKALGYPFDPKAFDAALDAIPEAAPMRLRLTLDASGRLETSLAPAPAPAADWRIAIAPDQLDSADPWRAVKSSNRALYDRTRALLPQHLDEAIFLNQGGRVCEGTITNLMIDAGQGVWITPPLSDGVLPGVMRAELLAGGGLRVAGITEADLRAAPRIRLCNALRGVIEVSALTAWPG
ncbi:aminotransferase class IV [Marinovum algicola]|uniref:aminotransferase class IV n=1 Tax=Marinovum algicola TaxID=42444 RepID=UPI0024BB6C9F|nr:aminotransferase class IV [Marinovum algicola]